MKTVCSLVDECRLHAAGIFTLSSCKEILLLVRLVLGGLACSLVQDLRADLEEGIFAYEEGMAAHDRGDHEIARREAAVALRELLPAAERGDPRYQHLIATLYFKGPLSAGSRRATQSEALRWMRRAAEQNWPEAEFDLGLMYRDGFGVPQDLEVARTWYIRAAEHGGPVVQLRLGTLYYHGSDSFGVQKDDEQALRWVRRAASQAFPPAEFLFGAILEEGRVVPRDFERAYYLYELAAQQGVAEAQGSLGQLYYVGDDVPRDCVKSAKWFLEAARRNLKFAQFVLARMYQTGECLPKDYVQAYLWYSNVWHEPSGSCIAAGDALNDRVRLEHRMTESEIKRAEEMWRSWTPIGSPSFSHGIELPRLQCDWLMQFSDLSESVW